MTEENNNYGADTSTLEAPPLPRTNFNVTSEPPSPVTGKKKIHETTPRDTLKADLDAYCKDGKPNEQKLAGLLARLTRMETSTVKIGLSKSNQLLIKQHKTKLKLL